MIMVCLSLVLVVILFKLYQTYQPPPPPPPRQASNTSFTSLDTQITNFPSQVELQPVFTTGHALTSYNGSDTLGRTVKQSHTCDLLYKHSYTEERNTKLRNKENPNYICRKSSASFCKSDISGSLQRGHCSFPEQTGGNGSMPRFQEKWHFPKYEKIHPRQKYLSL